jgi:hypothetical protein
MSQLLEMTTLVKHDTKRVICYLPLGGDDRIHELDQVRKTRPRTDEREVMLQSFLHNGQFTPGTIAALTKGQAVKYLKQIGTLWGKLYDIADYQPVLWKGDTRYFFLIAGHMRLETARTIARMSPKQLPQKPDEYRGSYYAELRFGLTAEQAIRIQINENVRISLHPVDEMFAAQMVWKWKKVSGKKFTLADLARMFGRSSSWAEASMLLAELPESTQRMAIDPGERDTHKAAVPRGYLYAVARLARFRAVNKVAMTEIEINREVLRVTSDNKITPAIYDQHVTQIISHESGDVGQTTMELLGGADGRVSYGNPVRQIVGQGLAKDAIALEQKLGVLLRMFEKGMLGQTEDEDSQPIAAEIDPEFLAKYAVGSPINNMGKLADIWVRLAPLMLSIAQAEGGRGRARIERALDEAGISRAVLEMLVTKEQVVALGAQTQAAE